MNTNERQIALSVLKSLSDDLMYAHLENGSRILDVADLRQYICEQMARMRTNAFVTDELSGIDSGPVGQTSARAMHGPDISKSNGHNGKAHS